MYQCPNCNGNLKFDIPSQMLKCNFCNTMLVPEAVNNASGAEESEYFDVTVFTCPQCAGELYSTENEATAFCSFCGASNILNSRLSTEKRPIYIVPFKKTKDDCKKAYSKMMKGAFYAPKELKNPANIDGFRGIYMPYWFYNIHQKGPIRMKGQKTYRRGNYMITDHYDLNCEIDAEYNSISYDGSSSFADNLSQAIAPYDVREAKAFTPAYLSGFYADTADVEKEVYRVDAMDIATEKSYKELSRTSAFRGMSYSAGSNSMEKAYTLNSACPSIDSAMLPVWFLSYRNGDRVAYATVNGQTGKVAADLPIDPKKYLFGSLLTAIPIFILLNMFFTMTPVVSLIFSMIMAGLTLILYAVELKQILRKESSLDDKGVMSKRKDAQPDKPKKPKKDPWYKNPSAIFVLVILGFQFGIQVIIFAIAMIAKYLWIGAFVAGIITCCISSNSLKQLNLAKKRHGYLLGMLSLIIATVVLVLNPVADYFYYIGVVASIIAIFFTIYDLIYYYNILATRKLPQFNRTGGDDRA